MAVALRYRTSIAVALALLVVSGLPAPAAAATPRPRKIVLISMPLVSWEDVAQGSAPNLARLAARWSMAALSLRTVGPRTDLASALLTIGAGNRARAGGAQPRTEGDAQDAPLAVAGGAQGARVRDFNSIVQDNADLNFGALPGSLGAALARRGLSTGVAGNADGGFIRPTSLTYRGTGLERKRFGALALADDAGRVGYAEIGDELVLADPSTLNGYRSNPEALAAAAAGVISAADVSLIELSDTYREGSIAFSPLRHKDPLPVPVKQVQAAVRRDDAALGRILQSVDLTLDTVLVLGPVSNGPGQREGLAMAVMAGVGARRGGWLTSATTLRQGLITVSDVGPGILSLLGIAVPKQMSGQPMRSVAGPVGQGDQRLDRIIRLQEESNFHVRWVGRFFLIFVGLQVVLYSVAWLRLRRPAASPTPWIRRLTLGFMAVPVSTLFLAAMDPQRMGPAGPLLFVLALSSALAAAALLGPWRVDPAGPPTFVCSVSLVVLLADLATGANLELSSLIGYSPIVAGRFYGIGNLAFAVLGTSALFLAAQIGSRYQRPGIWAAAAIGLVTIAADAGPGADFGGMLSLIPAFGILLIQLAGKRISWARVLALGTASAAVALVVGGLDAMRPPEQQTHVGRFVRRLTSEGPGAVQEVIMRKASANWALLTQSSLTLSVPIALIFLGMMLRRPEGRLRAALNTVPGLKAGVVASIVANVLGFALNDSGIAVPAMGLAVLAPFCLACVEGMPAPAKS